jgi:L-ascorbate 6-phosphate lactonase
MAIINNKELDMKTNFAETISAADAGKTHLFAVGQAGYIIKSRSEQLLGIDLYLSHCVEPLEGHVGFKRLLPQILQPSELQFNVLIATHPHYDHLDVDSIAELMSNGNTRLFASVDCRKLLVEQGVNLNDVTFVTPGDIHSVGDFTLRFVNSDHGAGAPDAVGVIVEVDGKVIFEAGDTCLRLDCVNEFKQAGHIDVMIAPINGAYGNLSEHDCAVLADALKPTITVPCHYGMFASHGGNPGLFINIMNKQYPQNKYLLMAQGEQYTIE